MDDLTAPKRVEPVLTDMPRYEGAAAPMPSYPPAPVSWKIPRLNLVLFLLTLLTTTMAGAEMAGVPVTLANPVESFVNLAAGLSFAIPLMAILFAHEMGHYLTSRRYGVDATLPYFIPAPFPSIFFVGTFGAFIRMRTLPRTRRAMFDIGAAGPWAGFVVAMIAVIVGLKYSAVSPLDTSTGGLQLGNSMVFWSVSYAVLGFNPNSVNVNLNPVAFAGWIGLLVTTLNLLPVGQLDGGHVVYSLLGGFWHRRVSRLVWIGTALMVIIPYLFKYDFWAGWLFWFVLVLFLGLGHPSTVDADTPLSGWRKWAAWATIALFIGTFSPVPAWFSPPSEPPEQGQTYNVMHRVPANHGMPAHITASRI